MIKRVFLISVILFLSVLLNPFGSEYIKISSSLYDIKKDTPLQSLISQDRDYFTIISLSNRATSCEFVFKDTLNIKIITPKNSTLEIIFNTKRLKNSTKGILLNIKSGDKLKIISSSGRSERIYILYKDSLLYPKVFTLLILIIFAIIYLYNKGYIYTPVVFYANFMLLLYIDRYNFGNLSFGTLLADGSLFMLLFLFFVFLYQIKPLLSKIYIYTVGNILSLLLLLIFIYNKAFHTLLSKDSIYAILQSNIDEIYAFVTTFVALKYILFLTLITLLVNLLIYLDLRYKKRSINTKILYIILMVLFLILYMNKGSFKTLKMLKRYSLRYFKEINRFKDFESSIVRYKDFNATKESNGELYIVVIGESLNKKEMSLYGYFRDTTPRLLKMYKNRDIYLAANSYSNHTHTSFVLSLALTEANQYNKKEFFDSLSIIDILNKAGFDTYWLSNQNSMSEWDNLVSVIAKRCRHTEFINKTVGKDSDTLYYDAKLIEYLNKIIEQKSNKNRAIFIHLMGSHFRYIDRYPKEFNRFNSKLKEGYFGKDAKKMIYVNEYDNSVYYNDYVVSEIIKSIKKTDKRVSLLYFSDHSEDAVESLGHIYSNFTYHMIEIPMILYFSDRYKKRYPKKYKNFLNNKEKLFSNDLIYDSLIGLTGVETNRYDLKYDIFSSDYNLSIDRALTGHGTKRYIAKSNFLYWQKRNIKYLNDTNQSKRVLIHRVDSIGKANDISNDGYSSFEIDIIFDKRGFFKVGHERDTKGITLQEYLIFMQNRGGITKIWLDIKNLNISNYIGILKRLEYLDRKYHIKNRAIVESDIKTKEFRLFLDNGWQTSYYLPTDVILKYIKSSDTTKLTEAAKSLNHQFDSQKVDAISFDSRLYPFVKEYLEPVISKSIIYHTWYGPDIYDSRFETKLKNGTVYRDTRVKTILCKYKSLYNL